MRLIINYDPVNGEAVPDGKIFSYVKDLVVIAEARIVPMEVTVGSSTIIEEIRALILEGVLSHKDILFKFERKELRVDKYGNLNSWPKGFCDTYENILERLVFHKENAEKNNLTAEGDKK
jgi:predicted ATPase